MSTRWETGRVEAFSDGVLAIAITLLVLEIGIDPSGFDQPWRALVDEWPSYLAYVTSFLTIGGVWLAHHGLFEPLAFVDPVLMLRGRGARRALAARRRPVDARQPPRPLATGSLRSARLADRHHGAPLGLETSAPAMGARLTPTGRSPFTPSRLTLYP